MKAGWLVGAVMCADIGCIIALFASMDMGWGYGSIFLSLLCIVLVGKYQSPSTPIWPQR